MRNHSLFDKIDLHLIRVLHTVLTERSVSKAAIRLGMHQPAVSGALKRLRDFAGDPLLVRSGSGMVPTDVALRMLEPSASILRAAEMLFSDAKGFEPATARTTFRVAASDYLDPFFLPRLVAQIKAQAPLTEIEILSLSGSADYRAQLAQGDVDVVIGNWPTPPDELHLGRLFGDDVVCLVSKKHPAVRRGWDQASWLAADHIAPGATHPGAKGVIDDHLASLGLRRHIAARCPYFGQIPAMVASTLLVMTTGRQYCERFTDSLPVTILPCPVEFPRLMYYQLWHARTHTSASSRWLRECVKSVAAALKKE
jgi:DNA-binding transcriptional LysR family regulator|nr:LysR family transcriptional regulator [uncultured Rhodoferax sp.]